MTEEKIPLSKDWHAQTPEMALRVFKTTLSGLEEQEAQKRQNLYGLNELPPPPKDNPFIRFLRQFHNILIYVLLGAALITFLLRQWIDASVILAVVIVNALIGFIQEGKAEKALEAIRHMLSSAATVIREGERQKVARSALVPGDIVFIEAGDKVPADLRLLKVHNLTIQEAILTGESISVEKSVPAVNVMAALGDRSSMAYSGTLVTKGQGTGVVVATGAATQIGRISDLLNQVQIPPTPLITQMTLFAKWLTFMILLVASLLFIYGYFIQHQPFTELFMQIVGLSVAAIPEGLPAVLSITMAIGVQAMAHRHAVIRRLPAIETIGAISVICTDKTGTLTRNEMTVDSVVISEQEFQLKDTGYIPFGDIFLKEEPIAVSQYPALKNLARAALLCNDAALYENEGLWNIEGDPMEGALLTFAGKAELFSEEEKVLWARTDIIPFDPSHRLMATLHHDHRKHAFIFVKGAPEEILKRVTMESTGDGHLQPVELKYWHQKINALTSKGQRVLAFAACPMPPEKTVLELKDIEQGLTLLGMTGLIDPPRKEAASAIAECYKAGIAVKMITGDHAGTALAIGKQIGLKNAEKVLTGAEIEKMDAAALSLAVKEINIFARTGPEHKLRLVRALQSQNFIVAMTGDGVNDAPALKRANIGIAMGQKGSEVAKEAAELVLTDDNFSSIIAAIREGRTIYDNLKKVISWTLPTNAGEAMTIVFALLAGMTLPITPIQILWVNLITTVTLGVALAFEPTEEKTMLRSPRPRYDPILTGTLVWQIFLVTILYTCGVFGIYFYAIDKGYSIALARTIALNTLVVMEIFYLFFIRNIYGTSLTWKAIRGTKVIWLCIIIIIVAQFSITYVPALQFIFATQAIPFWDGVLIVAVGIVVFALIEVEKQLHLRLHNMRNATAAQQTQ